MFGRRRIPVKTPDQLLAMRRAGLVVARTLAAVAAAAEPGVTTAELDALAERAIRAEGAVPSFLGYHGYPASICTSIDDEVVHGIPSGRRLREGMLLSVDCGAVLDGWHGDSAVTVAVGEVDDEARRLSAVTEEALWRGLAAARAGARLSDIGHAVESSVRADGPWGVVEEYVGHGIGTAMHMDPAVPNVGEPGRGPVLEAGVVLAVEPMVCAGGRHVHELADGWTVVTDDGRRAAHWEHTVAVTPGGPWVLTALDGGAARLAALGVPCGAVRQAPAEPLD